MFSGGTDLYSALTNVFFYIENYGTGGSGFRSMYANFLTEVAEIVNIPKLKEIANSYRLLAVLWSGLGLTALKDTIPLFRETRDLLTVKNRLFEAQRRGSYGEMQKINKRLSIIKAALEENFPLTQEEVMVLLNDLKSRIDQILNLERQAAETLIKIVN